jgi:hypothetical protein
MISQTQESLSYYTSQKIEGLYAPKTLLAMIGLTRLGFAGASGVFFKEKEKCKCKPQFVKFKPEARSAPVLYLILD